MLTDDERKEHQRAASAKYRLAHPERVAAYAARTAEEKRVRSKQHYLENRERILASRGEKLASADAKERYVEYHRAYRLAHFERRRELRRAYWAKNRAAILARIAAWAAANRDWKREYSRRYTREHLDQYRTYKSARRARKAGGGGRHSVAEWRALQERFGNCCAYCGEQKPLTRDHVIPIYFGGSDNIDNIVPACRSCNSSKRTLSVDEFIARRTA